MVQNQEIMIHLKIVLDKRRKKLDSTYPIVFRVTEVKKVTNLQSGISILDDYWDNTNLKIINTHPNAHALNFSLTKKYYDLQKVILALESESTFSIENLKIGLGNKPLPIKNKSFYQFSTQLINEMIEVDRVGNAIVYRTAVNRLIAFINNKEINFKEIDFTFLDNFKRKLIIDGVKPNTIGNYFRSIRAIYNKAIKSKIIDRAYYPFVDISIKTEKTAKRAISKESLIKITEINIKTNSREFHAVNYFLLSFSLIGISFTDLAYLKNSNIKKGRVSYKRRKTHKNYDIKLSPLGLKILKLYENNGEYLIPILNNKVKENSFEAKKIISQWIKTTNKWLNRIGEANGIDSLTTYVSRHSWATIAKRLGFSNELIAESLGHEYGNKITNIYLDTFEQNIIDDLNLKVQENLKV